jgi:hypothetical protein
MTEKVIFRVDKSTGEVFALFPEVPANHVGIKCKSTRGPADVKACIHDSRPATKAEYTELAKALGKIKIVQRETPAMRGLRQDSVYVGELPPVANNETPNKRR